MSFPDSGLDWSKAPAYQGNLTLADLGRKKERVNPNTNGWYYDPNLPPSNGFALGNPDMNEQQFGGGAPKMEPSFPQEWLSYSKGSPYPFPRQSVCRRCFGAL